MSTSSSSKVILLKSSNGQDFEVPESVAVKSETIKSMIDDGCADGAIPLPNVTANILAKVTEYCKKHVEEEAVTAGCEKSYVDDDPDGLKEFDSEFVKVEQGTLFSLMLAANYLNVKSLLDLTCQTVANMMKGKKPEEIRKMFNIVNDYTPEEEEQVRKEYAWAFED